jgi:signal peptidase
MLWHNMHRIQNIIYNLAVGFIIASISIGGLKIYQSAGSPDLSEIQLPQAYVILSGSMEPVIRTGSVVFVFPQEIYIKGDVVTFAVDGDRHKLVTHRLASSSDKGIYFAQPVYTTKGDANKTEDFQELAAKNILGKVFFSIPLLGYAVDFAKKPQGFILLVIVPATIIIYEELKSLKRHVVSYIPKIRKKKNVDSHDIIASNNLPKYFVAFPVIVVVIIGISASRSYFVSRQQSQGNIFRRAEPTPTPTVMVTPTVTPTPTPQIAQTLVINEILPLSSCNQGQTNGQFIELWNGNPADVDLKDYKLSDGTSTIAIANAVKNLPSHTFAILVKSNGIIQNCLGDIHGAMEINLGGNVDLNTGKIQLLDKSNNIIDTVEWKGITNLNPAVDQSVARKITGFDTATGSAYAASDFNGVSISPGQ